MQLASRIPGLRTTLVANVTARRSIYRSGTSVDAASMATASQVQFDTKQRPVFAVSKLSAESAAAASTHLQKNHENHHIFFNDDGFHVSKSYFTSL